MCPSEKPNTLKPMLKCDVYSAIIKATATETKLRPNFMLTEGFRAGIIIFRLYFCIYKKKKFPIASLPYFKKAFINDRI